jgi:hypothetical protein
MKMIAASIPLALLTFGVLGCTQQASTSPTVERPVAAPTSSNTNTFGESREEAAGSAASARDANYGTDQATAASGATAESTPPK